MTTVDPRIDALLEKLAAGQLEPLERAELAQAAERDPEVARDVELFAPLTRAERVRARPPREQVTLRPRKASSAWSWGSPPWGVLAAAAVLIAVGISVWPAAAPPTALEVEVAVEGQGDRVHPDAIATLEVRTEDPVVRAFLRTPDGFEALPWVFRAGEDDSVVMKARAAGLTLHHYGLQTLRVVAGPASCASVDPALVGPDCRTRDVELRVQAPAPVVGVRLAKLGTLAAGEPPREADPTGALRLPAGGEQVTLTFTASRPVRSALVHYLYAVQSEGWTPLGEAKQGADAKMATWTGSRARFAEGTLAVITLPENTPPPTDPTASAEVQFLRVLGPEDADSRPPSQGDFLKP